MGWIKTYTGRHFHPLSRSPSASDVCLEDVAHALSMKVRFVGHLSKFYSVAEHSVRVARLLQDQHAPTDVILSGLLHDVGEAYLPDIASPNKGQVYLKLDPDEDGATDLVQFRDQERRIRRAIYEALGLPDLIDPDHSEQITQADLVLLSTEARDMLGGTGDWEGEYLDPLPARIRPMSPEYAETVFLCWYEFARVHYLMPRHFGDGGGA